jgi:hypothetical protein
MASLAGLTESLLDANNSTIYCDTTSGTPFGGDDTGFLPPPKSTSAKCEAGAAKAEGKLIACIQKCHASRASGKRRRYRRGLMREDARRQVLRSEIHRSDLQADRLPGVHQRHNHGVACRPDRDFARREQFVGLLRLGSMTQPSASAPCRVTVKAPSADIVLVGTLGDAWTVSSFTGFSSCVLTGVCTANGGTRTSCNGVDAPSSCPPLGIPNCTDNRPSWSTGLNGNASDSAHVTCSP